MSFVSTLFLEANCKVALKLAAIESTKRKIQKFQ